MSKTTVTKEKKPTKNGKRKGIPDCAPIAVVVEAETQTPEWEDDGSKINADVSVDLEDLCARARESPDHDWGEVKRPWMRKFLNALTFRPVIAFACRSVKVSDQSVIDWRKKDPAFDEAVKRALDLGWDTVEEAAHRRAVDGVPKAIFGKDDQVIGVEMKYSDTLTELLLRGHKPERYRDKSGPLVTVNINAMDEAMEKAIEDGSLGEFALKLTGEEGASAH